MAMETNPYTGLLYSRNFHRLREQRNQLPVSKYKHEFKNLFLQNQCIVVVGETGSGKSTQIPQWCVEYSSTKCVACTQPRQGAATSIARRVADEMDVKIGNTVGYTIRFKNCSNWTTQLKYMTDGMLLRQSIIDPNLSDYGTIIIDEAHELNTATYELLTVLNYLMNQRNDLKVIIMSATVNAEKFQNYFKNAANGNVPIMRVPGKTYPVKIFYSTLEITDYKEKSVAMILDIHVKCEEGDILVFLTGEEEIKFVKRKVDVGIELLNEENSGKLGRLNCLPLYSSLPIYEQNKIHEPKPSNKPNGAIGRKVILATNIAETSLTIDGIVFVIDCGFEKQNTYNLYDRSESLDIKPISQACADQRAGRAGRTRAGVCYRLYTKQQYGQRAKHSEAEIHRINLENVVLRWKKRESSCDVAAINFIEPLMPDKLYTAIESLRDFDALDTKGTLTNHGSNMAEFPVEPHFASAIIASVKYNCINDVIPIIAMLTVSDCFCRPRDNQAEANEKKKYFTDMNSDFITLLNVFKKFQLIPEDLQQNWCNEYFINLSSLALATKVSNQLSNVLKRLNLKTEMSCEQTADTIETRIKKSLLHGFFMNVACATGTFDAYSIIKNVKHFGFVYLDASCCLKKKIPKWIIFNECRLLNKKNNVKIVTDIEPSWLTEVPPSYFSRLFREHHNKYDDTTPINQLKKIFEETSWHQY